MLPTKRSNLVRHFFKFINLFTFFCSRGVNPYFPVFNISNIIPNLLRLVYTSNYHSIFPTSFYSFETPIIFFLLPSLPFLFVTLHRSLL